MLPFCLQYVLLLIPEAVLVLGRQLVLAMKGTLSSSAWETDFTFSTSFIFVYLTVYVCLCVCVCVGGGGVRVCVGGGIEQNGSLTFLMLEHKKREREKTSAQ